MQKLTPITPTKILEINQIALITWAINRRANEIVEYPWEKPRNRSLRQYLNECEPDHFILLKRWLKKDLRWDWFMGCFDLWRCGIEPYASNQFLDTKYNDRLDEIQKYPKKPLFSKNTHT